MKKIIVLGSGLVGSVMATDLAKKYEVTSVDISKKNLDKIHSEKINKICADVLEKDILYMNSRKQPIVHARMFYNYYLWKKHKVPHVH